ncbi:type II toxin-antitoxin system VapC family toxin [Methylotuvimicrobium buryatense]|uniref:Ribonuclease VapC n=1 Tax=Methylotuvimicrobium buryatense TaxID=95641 RepID=A0A4P9UQV5_METBY|nr:PIN domain-containing protein [Methylotuvimicrobium buryatense]QCW83828.1 PIN domain-containing protein [Methylotuvimicrobium buryatense]
MMMTDSGFWVALVNPDDHHHATALDALSAINEPLITTYPVITEVCHLLLKRRGIQSMLAFVESYRQEAFSVFQINDAKHKDPIVTLMQQYADLPMDFADASLVLLAESLGHGRILSTDKRDFHTYRWKNHYPFFNMLPV